MLPQRESLPAVTAAGVVAIILASLGVLACGFITLVLLMMPNLPNQPGKSAMPLETRAMVIGVYAVLFAICVGELVIAINVLRRKNWARIALLIWAGIMVFFSALTCLGTLFALNFLPQTGPTQKDPNFLLFMKFFMLILYGIPFAVAVWWLILFNRPRVAAAFKAPLMAAPVPWGTASYGFPAPAFPPVAVPAALRKPSCPVPLLIVAIFLLFSAVTTPLILLIPNGVSAPIFLFGFLASPLTSKVILSSLSVVYGVLAIGMIRLKLRALDAIIVLQAIFLINGMLSLASPAFMHAMQETVQQNAMNNPALPNGLPFLSQNFLKWALIGGIAFSSALLGLLVGFRDRFRKAAAEAAS